MGLSGKDILSALKEISCGYTIPPFDKVHLYCLYSCAITKALIYGHVFWLAQSAPLIWADYRISVCKGHMWIGRRHRVL